MALSRLHVTVCLYSVQRKKVGLSLFKRYKIQQGYVNGDTHDSLFYRVLSEEVSEFLIIA